MRVKDIEYNKIYNEDCLEGMKQIPDGVVDMILCDPPFGTTANPWDKRIPFEAMWEQYKRITKPNAAIVLFSQMPFGSDLIQSNRKMFRYEWIWQKNCPLGFLNANKMPLRAHENILVFYQKLPTYNPQKWRGKPFRVDRKASIPSNYTPNFTRIPTNNVDGMHYPVDIIRAKNTGPGKVHSTQKPTDLLEYLIKTYTNEGELVLDNCIGSGSTAVACVNTNRNFIGFETERKYCEIAEKRIAEAQAAKEMRLAI